MHYYDATPFTFQWEGNGKFPGRILASADGGGANGRPCTRGQWISGSKWDSKVTKGFQLNTCKFLTDNVLELSYTFYTRFFF